MRLRTVQKNLEHIARIDRRINETIDRMTALHYERTFDRLEEAKIACGSATSLTISCHNYLDLRRSRVKALQAAIAKAREAAETVPVKPDEEKYATNARQFLHFNHDEITALLGDNPDGVLKVLDSAENYFEEPDLS